MAAGLGISIGSATLVAVTDGSTGETQQVRLPSALQLDDGSVITGFVERVGDPIPILAADGTEYRGEALAATAVGALVDQAGGNEGPTVVLAHPVGWNRHTARTMESALDDAGIHGATLVAEPAAVMAWLAASGTVVSDGLTVVYDLGARSLDVTMMSTTDGRSEIFGKPLRSEDIGGDEFDHLVTVHLLDAVSDQFATLDPFAPETIAALETLREHARAAKEELSTETETVARVALPGAVSDVRLVRSELEDLIRPALTESVALVRESLRSAGVESSDVNQVVLAGGSSSIPLVAELLSAELRVPVIADADPASCAASGAATLALDARDSQVPAAATTVIPAEPSRKPAPVPAFSTPLLAEPTEEENTATRRSSRVASLLQWWEHSSCSPQAGSESELPWTRSTFRPVRRTPPASPPPRPLRPPRALLPAAPRQRKRQAPDPRLRTTALEAISPVLLLPQAARRRRRGQFRLPAHRRDPRPHRARPLRRRLHLPHPAPRRPHLLPPRHQHPHPRLEPASGPVSVTLRPASETESAVWSTVSATESAAWSEVSVTSSVVSETWSVVSSAASPHRSADRRSFDEP